MSATGVNGVVPSPELALLFTEVAKQLDADLVGAHELQGGSSAIVWQLDLRRNGAAQPVVFRQHRRTELKEHGARVASKEFGLLNRLHALGFPVANALLLSETDQFLVTEFITGASFVTTAQIESAVDQMVDLLVRLHSLDIELVEAVELPALEDPLERLRNCLPSSAAGRELASRLRHGQAALHPNPPVLIHGDYWPGNVLWRNGELAGLIDWEDACLGDPLADLACSRVELLCQYGPTAMDDFTVRYLDRTAALDTRSLPVWECYVSATALASMHLWGLAPAEEARRRSLTESFFDKSVRATVPEKE